MIELAGIQVLNTDKYGTEITRLNLPEIQLSVPHSTKHVFSGTDSYKLTEENNTTGRSN